LLLRAKRLCETVEECQKEWCRHATWIHFFLSFNKVQIFEDREQISALPQQKDDAFAYGN